MAGALLILSWTLLQHAGRDRLWAVLGKLGPLVLFSCWALLSTAWSSLPMISLNQSASLLALVVLAISIATFCRGPQDTSTIVRRLSWGLLALSSCLLLLRFAMPDVGSMTRDAGGVLHATYSASTAALGLLLVVAGVLLYDWRWSRRLLIPALAVHTPVLLLSANRMSFVMLLLALAVMLAAPRRRRFIPLAVLIGSLVATVYLSLDPGHVLLERGADSVGAYASRGQTGLELSALSGREEMWRAIWKSYQQSPWIGHGYFVSSKSGQLLVWYEWGNWTAHNALLQVLVTTGAIGATLLLLGFVRLAWSVWRSYRQGDVSGQHPALLAVAAVWFAGWSCLNESFAGPLQPECVVFFTLVGLAAASGNSRSEPRNPKQTHNPKWECPTPR